MLPTSRDIIVHNKVNPSVRVVLTTNKATPNVAQPRRSIMQGEHYDVGCFKYLFIRN
jgi:hypothetical protein